MRDKERRGTVAARRIHQAHPRWVFAALLLVLALLALGMAGEGAKAASPMIPSASVGETVDMEGADLLSGDLTAEERLALLARLSDDQIRDLLIRYLEGIAADRAAASESPAGMLQGLQAEAHLVRENLIEVLAQASNLPTVLPFAYGKLTEGRDAWHPLRVLLLVLVLFAVAAGAEWLFRRATQALRTRLTHRESEGAATRLGAVAGRLMMELLCLGVFAFVVIGLFFATWQGHEPTRIAATTYVMAVLIVRLTATLSRVLLAPWTPELRLAPFSDAAALSLHRWIFWSAVVGAFGFLSCAMMQLLGLADALHTLLLMIVAAIFILMLLAMIWDSRRDVARLIRGEEREGMPISWAQRVFAEIWHILAALYVVGVYVFAVLAGFSGHSVGLAVPITSLLILVAVPIADALIGQAIADALSKRRREGEQAAGPSRTERVMRRAARILLILITFALLARMWGLDITSLAEQSVGAVVTRAALDIGLTLLVAYVGWELLRAAFDRHLAQAEDGGEGAGDGEGGGQGATRLQTLLPLIRRFLQIVIIVMVVMIVLASLGVNIAPLLAGAGVVGLAVGFGAQTLVRDIMSGIFFLLDDAFRLGEYVDIGSVKGVVEGINVRSLVLRHHMGPLHTVPFGEIRHLTNYSRDWVIMKLEFRVTYDTDLNKVKKIFKTIGAEMLEHEELGQYFLAPFKSQGVKSMEDSAMIVRGKFMAKPGFQFQIRKEIYNRVQQAFRDNGIEFAHRRVAVDLPPGIAPTSPEGQAITDAAAAAVASETADPKPKPA